MRQYFKILLEVPIPDQRHSAVIETDSDMAINHRKDQISLSWQWTKVSGIPWVSIRVSDNFGPFAWRVFLQEELVELVIVNFGGEVPNKNWVFRARRRDKFNATLFFFITTSCLPITAQEIVFMHMNTSYYRFIISTKVVLRYTDSNHNLLSEVQLRVREYYNIAIHWDSNQIFFVVLDHFQMTRVPNIYWATALTTHPGSGLFPYVA